MSNGSIRVKLKNEAVSIITRNCDLVNLFSDNRLIEDYYSGPGRLSCSSLQLFYENLSGINSELIKTPKMDLFFENNERP